MQNVHIFKFNYIHILFNYFYYTNHIKNIKYSNILIKSICSLLGFQLYKFLYVKYCNYITFNRLDKLYPRNIKWEQELQIYSVSMPKLYSSIIKKKCVLFISGYRDIPYVWSEILPYFEADGIDYYTPRTYGNGRSFFQDVEPQEWIITYIEAIYTLQNIYQEIEIVAFSTGCVIALYISQFNYKCKINNIFLCAPFLLKNDTFIDYFLFNSIWATFFNPLFNLFFPLRIKTPECGFKYVRDTYNDFLAQTDFYELCGFFKLETKLLKFKNLRPTNIFANNITILYPLNDVIIGDVYKQRDIIFNIFKKYIMIIPIPSIYNYNNSYNNNNKCGHVMFKENADIISNIYTIIKNIINQ